MLFFGFLFKKPTNESSKIQKTKKPEPSKNHEIASHGYSHSEPITPSNIKKAKEIKEEIINKKIKGFRAPRWNIKDTNIVDQADFEYDSEINVIELYETELKRDERIMRYLNVSLDKDANNWAVKRRKKLKKDKA